MKFITSVLSVTIIAVILTVWMIDFSEAQCSVVCTADYRPVCGQRGQPPRRRTFGNACALSRENQCGARPPWRQIHTGECRN